MSVPHNFDPQTNTSPPVGFTNNGNTCWLNAATQLLLSLYSFEKSVALATKPKNSTISVLFNAMVSPSSNTPAIILASMKDPTFTPGRQECSDEGLTRILHHVDPIHDINGVALLPFAVGFRRFLICGVNNNSGSDTAIETQLTSDNLLIVPYKHDYDASTPDEFFSGIRTHKTEIFADCNKCNKKHKQTLRGSIERLNDIILVRFNKITAAGGSKKVIWYPYEFSSPYVGGRRINFQLVATIEHSGGDGGGHYYARVRRGRQWYLCNDASVTPIPNADPAADTFIVAYHVVGIVS